MNLKIFTDLVEYNALEQIYTLAKIKPFENAKIRIMPDVHAGAGCVIGFTADLGNKVIPNIVGVDIGCGMYVVPLGQRTIDFEKLDKVIRTYVPSGLEVHKDEQEDGKMYKHLHCYNELRNIDWLFRSFGTLGGGNHFIEIDKDEEDNFYLIIHTGSRNLGKQVAEIYQKLAINSFSGKRDINKKVMELIATLKEKGEYEKINDSVKALKEKINNQIPTIPKELCYLENEDRENYLHDMELCQNFAYGNRERIAFIIFKQMGWNTDTLSEGWHCIHNYISFKDNIVRKGAISARKGESVLIPLNMRDGCILGVGKGNEDWNCSAPHGAGRIMSRTQAKQEVSLEDFKKSMEGIYTTSVNITTIDESPFVYKPAQSIIDNIKDTVDIQKIIKPVYNFKAN